MSRARHYLVECGAAQSRPRQVQPLRPVKGAENYVKRTDVEAD